MKQLLTSTKEQIENLIKKTNYNKISKISFFLNLTNNDENVNKGDYIKSRFSELKFGGNNN